MITIVAVEGGGFKVWQGAIGKLDQSTRWMTCIARTTNPAHAFRRLLA
jgi:hypothetical protein